MSSVSVPTTKVIMLATQVKKSKGLEKKHGGGLSIWVEIFCNFHKIDKGLTNNIV